MTPMPMLRLLAVWTAVVCSACKSNDQSGPDAGSPVVDAGRDFSKLPRFQEVVPWTPPEYFSANADTWHFFWRFCYDPTSKAIWLGSDTYGCDAGHDEIYPLADFKEYLRQHWNRAVTIGLNAFFPDGTFEDRRLDGTVVTYVSRLEFPLVADPAYHAYNLHDPRTAALFREAYAAVIHSFDGIGNIIGWQIGYNIYQENLVGTFGFTPQALNRFVAAWNGGMAAESRLGPADLAAVSALVSALVPDDRTTWPLPVEVDDPIHDTDSPSKRARRFYYAYFQKFRQRDLAALRQSLFDTVKAEAGQDAWVEMYNAQLNTLGGLPAPVLGQGFIQFEELAMLRVLDPYAPALFSLGKDEAMYLQGYLLGRCANTNCEETPGHGPLGVCPSTKGGSCVCEPVDNGCVDDWRLDRTVAYVLRDRANGFRHRLNDQYVRSGYTVQGNDWSYDDAIRLADFRTLDALIFGGYGTVGGASFESQIDDSSPVQVRLYYPVWVQGAVTRLFGPTPYATGRSDREFLENLLESRGVKFQPINDDWSQLTTPVIVPFYDLIAPMLPELPGYDPTKVIPQNTIPIASPSPVDAGYADAVMAQIAARVPGLSTLIETNPLERTDPSNDFEPYWVLKVGGYDNVVYNLSEESRCIELKGSRSLALSPFEVRIVTSSTNDRCR